MIAPPALVLTADEARVIRAQATREAPHECCGVLMARAGRREVIAGRNVQAGIPPATHAYRMDAETAAKIAARLAAGWTLVAVYHSHTHGTPALSRTDERQETTGRWWWRRPRFPGTAQLVVSVGWRRKDAVLLAAYGWSSTAPRGYTSIPVSVDGMLTRRVGVPAK